MATTATNKTEIDQLGQAATKQAQDIAEQKVNIDELNAELNRLKISKNKTPAKPPPVFDAKKFSFHTWAAFAKNYFERTSINSNDDVGLLLTYLNPTDYSAVCRVYKPETLVTENFDKAVDMISHIISDKVDRSKAVSKLLKQKQGNLSIQEFLNKLAEMAEIGFPEPDMEDAKQRCLTSALQANVRSKLLSYEIHRFLTDKPNISFEELSLRVLELEQVLAGEESGDEELDRTHHSRSLDVLNVTSQSQKQTTNNQVRKCFICQSPEHLKANCPQKPKHNSTTNYNSRQGPNRNFNGYQRNNFRRNYTPQNYRQNFRPFRRSYRPWQNNRPYRNNFRYNYRNNQVNYVRNRSQNNSRFQRNSRPNFRQNFNRSSNNQNFRHNGRNSNFQNRNWRRNTVKLIKENVPTENNELQEIQYDDSRANDQQASLNYQGSWD